MNYSIYFILLITLFPHNLIADNASDLITTVCAKALYKDFCITVLQSNSNVKNPDMKALASIALKSASSNATEIYGKINTLLNTTLEPGIEQALTDCSENYQDAIDQLDDSLAALDSKAYNDVNTWVTAAMSDAESCDEGLKEKQDKVSQLPPLNELFNKLCSVTLAVTNNLINP